MKHFDSLDIPNLVICPSYIYIPYFLKHSFKVGSQDVCCSKSNSCTGEVSAEQLKSIGVSYTLIGHSERRQKLRETDLDINKKIKNSLSAGLKVILCIGEKQEDVDLLKKDIVLKNQIKKALVDIESVDNIIIAYEPVWSVGTNKVPSNKEISDTVNYIKQIVFNFHFRTRNLDNWKIIEDEGWFVTDYDFYKNSQADLQNVSDLLGFVNFTNGEVKNMAKKKHFE